MTSTWQVCAEPVSTSVVEAAEVLGLNPSTARGRYAAARTALREALMDVTCS